LTQFDAGYVPPRAGKVKVWFYPFLALGAAELALKRKLSLSVSRMWQWWVTHCRNPLPACPFSQQPVEQPLVARRAMPPHTQLHAGLVLEIIRV
jgi:hypothetical protein